MLLPFSAGHKRGKSFAIDTETLVNCYVEKSTKPNAKSLEAIYGRPGTRAFGNWGERPARGVHQFDPDPRHLELIPLAREGDSGLHVPIPSAQHQPRSDARVRTQLIR